MKRRKFPQTKLAEHAQLYLHDREDELSPSSMADYRSVMRRLCEKYPHEDIEDFDGPGGTRLLQDFLSSEIPRDSRAKVIKHFHAFFDWAEYYELVKRDPSRRLKAPRPQSKRRTPQSVESIQAIIDAQPQLNWRVAIMLGAMLGQRRGSVRGIRLQDFNLASGHVSVRLKGGRRAVNPLVYPEIKLAVERLVQDGALPQHYLLYPIRKNNLPQRKSDWLHMPDRPISESAFSRWWTACVARAGDIPYFDFHTLRVSAGTRLYLQSGDLLATSKALNHMKVETTQQHYISIDELNIISAYEKASW